MTKHKHVPAMANDASFGEGLSINGTLLADLPEQSKTRAAKQVTIIKTRRNMDKNKIRKLLLQNLRRSTNDQER